MSFGWTLLQKDYYEYINTHLNLLFFVGYYTEILEEVEILIKYRGYIEKEKLLAEKLIRLDKMKINTNFDYLSITSLSKESREKLSKQKPESIGQASRISGVSPADVSILLVHLGR